MNVFGCDMPVQVCLKVKRLQAFLFHCEKFMAPASKASKQEEEGFTCFYTQRVTADTRFIKAPHIEYVTSVNTFAFPKQKLLKRQPNIC